MKVCPKCSLNIRGNASQCPICKVDLPPSAVDHTDIGAIPHPPEETQSKTLIPEMDHPSSMKEEGYDIPLDIDLNESKFSDLNKRLGILEGAVKEIEKKIVITVKQLDRFQKSIQDMKARMAKLDQSPDKKKERMAYPEERDKETGEGYSRLVAQVHQIHEAFECLRNDVSNHQAIIDRQCNDHVPSQDKVGETRSRVKRLTGYLKGLGYSSMVRDVKGRGKKRKIFFNISVLGALLLTSLLCFYYLVPRNQNDRAPRIERKIVKRIEPLARPEQNAIGSLKKTVETVFALQAVLREKAPEPEESTMANSQRKTPAPVSENLPKEQGLPSVQSNDKPAPIKKSGEYTINIGSFRDRKHAQALTERVRKKGYPVVMFSPNSNGWYRISVGAFSTVKEARAFASILEKSEKLSFFIMEMPPEEQDHFGNRGRQSNRVE